MISADVGKQFYEMADLQKIYAEDGCHPNEEGLYIAERVIADTILRDWEKKWEQTLSR